MTLCKSRLDTPFSLEGTFLGFVREDNKIKYLRVAVAANELTVKLSKELRKKLYQILMPGDWIEVTGERKLKAGGELKLKALQVNKLAVVVDNTLPEICGKVSALKPSKIRVCQGSGCRKRGGKKLLSGLEVALEQLGLRNQVIVEQTGCVKRCSSAPNVVLPGKNRCGKLHPDAIAQLIEEHFADRKSQVSNHCSAINL